MSEIRGRIFYAEAYPSIRTSIENIIALDGHEVVVGATNTQTALTLIAGDVLEKMAVNLAIVGNTPFAKVDMGPAVSLAIKDRYPDLPVIALGFLKDGEPYGNYQIDHLNEDIIKTLLGKIEEILRKGQEDSQS